MRRMENSRVEWIGKIPEGWETIRIKYLLSFINGYAFDSQDLVLDYKYPVIRIGDIKDGAIDYNNCQGIHDNSNLGNYQIQENDILIAMSGATVGKVGLVNDTREAYINQRVGIIRTNQYKFMFYSLSTKSFVDYILLKANGSAQPNVSSNMLGEFHICLPPLHEQQAIADYLDRQCSHIDSIIEKTKTSIEEYKKLMQSIITQAVTKGVRGDRSMKDSGIEWIGEIPEEWDVLRIASLYEERSEPGSEDLPILTVSINTGVSDRELSDEESERVFVRSEDKTKYARVYPGDLTYNMMRAWQGAFGAVRVDGMVSPAYVIAKPKREIDSRYMEALLRTSDAKEEMKRYSYGIADFRLRLYWAYFKVIKVCLPSLEEQREISDYIDMKSTEIEALKEKKELFISELESCKKSMIYEYVTGKKEICS